jgi:phosphatidylserine/phosphatidylglycerophosphate/cardiolipin synthase-like enzyme
MLRADGLLVGAKDRPPATGEFDIFEVGRNCCSIGHAHRASVLVDGAAYFAALDSALRQARRSILIIGWDFDAGIKLRPDSEEPCPSLGELLRALVEERPDLEVRILIWNLAVVHASGASLPLIFGAAWQQHPRIRLHLDNGHPVYGAQHHKIVCIDDSLAFVGGTDLTIGRWDTPAHAPDDPRRVNPDGAAYGPVHDLQIVVEGDAARCVADVALARWQAATGEKVERRSPLRHLWPDGLTPDFSNVPVAIARTAPRWGKARGVREIAALNIDAIKSAREAVYIEAQYLADSSLRDELCASLARPTGPEIVILVTHAAHGILERWIMGGNRDRVIRKLRREDRHGRFGVFFPVLGAGEGASEIFIHSKLLIVDDRFLRIGSSNFNRRSMGLDTECDLAIEAGDAASRATIARIRDTLLAEHLGVAPAIVRGTVAREGSLLAAIRRLNGNARRLQEYEVRERGSTHLMPGTRLLDPRKPFPLLSLFRRRRSQPHF